MNKINIGLIGLGNVGTGVIKFLQKRKSEFKKQYDTAFHIKTICDRSYKKKLVQAPASAILTDDINKILKDDDIQVVIELIGGMKPAKQWVAAALKRGKHVITANKELIANSGEELFQLAQRHKRGLYFESAVGAGIPIIKTISEGVAGNKFDGLYGIINGTCNYILTEMTKNNCGFKEALESAQAKGFAESDPTLDINGMDSAHKLSILIHLAFGKYIKVRDIHTEGITHISHTDIEHAESLGLTIKLLAIAKEVDNKVEARVHPTLISKDHPLASINGIYNAVFLSTQPLGKIMISGEGAGQMAAASGVISDLINLTSHFGSTTPGILSNIGYEHRDLKRRKIDHIKTRFYIRFMATDKPGVLSKITGVLGKHNIGINSVHQKAHSHTATVPVVILTDYAPEKMVRQALQRIHRLPIIKSKPVAIRMENL